MTILATCPVCGEEFDWESAERCPHCGTIIDG